MAPLLLPHLPQMRIVPRSVRAQVALQAAYDYVDTLAEQTVPGSDSQRRSTAQSARWRRSIPTGPRIDYYAHHPQQDDAGYLQCIVETCRARSVRASLLRLGGGADAQSR